jgi:hypothetical protein
MPEDVEFAVRTATKETDPVKIFATGYGTIDLFLPFIPVQPTGSPDVDDPAWLPSSVTNYGSWDSIKTSGLGVTTDDYDWMEFLADVKAQVASYWKMLRTQTWPSMTGATCAYALLLEDVEHGMLDQPGRRVQANLSTAATTLTHMLEGFNPHDGGAGGQFHILRLRRLLYFWSYNWSDRLIPLAQNIAATASMTLNFERQIEIVTALMIDEIWHFFVLWPMQADRAVFNLAFMDRNLTKLKSIEEMATAVDEQWYDWIKENKVAYVDETKMPGHEVFDGDFINDSLIQANTLDTTFFKIENYNFKVPAVSLQLARMTAGIGKTGDNALFAMLPHGVQQDTGYASHGQETWCLGLETHVNMKFLVDEKGWDDDIIKSITQNKHYTFIDLQSFIKDYFTDFNIVKNLNGLAEPEIHWCARKQFPVADDPMEQSNGTEVARSPMSNLDTGTLITADDDYIDWQSLTPWRLVPLQGMIPEYYSLYIPSGVTLRMMGFELLFNLIFDIGADAGWQDYHYKYDVHRYVQVIDHKTKEVKDWVYSVAGTQGAPLPTNHLRWESLGDVCINTYQSIALKYNYALVENGHVPFEKNFQSARPHGIDEAYGAFIDHFTHPINLRKFARLLMAKQSAAPEKKTVTQQDPKVPESVTKPSEQDEELT